MKFLLARFENVRYMCGGALPPEIDGGRMKSNSLTGVCIVVSKDFWKFVDALDEGSVHLEFSSSELRVYQNNTVYKSDMVSWNTNDVWPLIEVDTDVYMLRNIVFHCCVGSPLYFIDTCKGVVAFSSNVETGWDAWAL